MPTEMPRPLLESHYERAAQEYLYNLTPEHFMEATAQATQRKITLSSMDQVRTLRPEIQTFNELLVQYDVVDSLKPGQVVPDNMVVVHPEPIVASGHFSLALQPTRPFWVMEYVSNSSRRKDYVDSMAKYEGQLKVPYYLLFYPDNQELSLFRHNGTKYVSVLPDDHGLHAIAELEMAVALVDGWARYYFRGELLPLTGELQREAMRLRLRAERAERERDHAELARQEADRKREQAEREAVRLRQETQEADRQRDEAQKAMRDMAAQFAQMQADLARLRQSGDSPS